MHETDICVCGIQSRDVNSKLWPGAEDRALRGRNLSAVSRTLYRRVGKAHSGLPSCAGNSWRVENQSEKSTVQITQNTQNPQIHYQTKQPQSAVHFFRASTSFAFCEPQLNLKVQRSTPFYTVLHRSTPNYS